MATISFQVTESGQTNATKTFTLADAQLDRFIAALQIPANAAVNATATRAQVLNYWANSVMAAAVQTVQTYEQQAAVSTAVATVTAITPV